MMDLQRVPVPLHGLIAFAQKFGVADDRVREAVVLSASAAQASELKRAVQAADAALDAWLAGPEAAGPDFSDEYIAFSAPTAFSGGAAWAPSRVSVALWGILWPLALITATP